MTDNRRPPLFDPAADDPRLLKILSVCFVLLGVVIVVSSVVFSFWIAAG